MYLDFPSASSSAISWQRSASTSSYFLCQMTLTDIRDPRERHLVPRPGDCFVLERHPICMCTAHSAHRVFARGLGPHSDRRGTPKQLAVLKLEIGGDDDAENVETKALRWNSKNSSGLLMRATRRCTPPMKGYM